MTDKHPFPLGLALHELSRVVRREFEAKARQLGFTEGQWRTLWYVNRNEGISQARLADLLEMQPISLVRVLDRLEVSGLIERRPDPKDRRAVKLYLTEAAGPTLQKLRRFAEEMQATVLGQIPEREIEHFVDTLNHLRQTLDTSTAKAHAS